MSTQETFPSEELVLEHSATAVAPKDFILYSYNALDNRLAQSPDKLMDHLSRNVAVPLTNDEITVQTVAQRFTSRYNEDRSAQETLSSVAASVGIEGKYGFFSGSVQATYEREENQKSTSFNSNLSATVSCGTIYYRNSEDYKAIRSHLDPVMLSTLDNINTLADAQAFTRRYGTHIILGLNVGGVLTIRAQAGTSSYSGKEEVSLKVKAAYDTGISNISAAASASQKLSTELSTSSFTQVIVAAGGNAALAAAINKDKTETFTDWAKSCTPDTVYGISNSLEVWKLANTDTAQKTLQAYYDLLVLCQSVNRPTIFSTYSRLKPYVTNSATAIVPDGYKVISGGAKIARHSKDQFSSSFLRSSCPVFDIARTRVVGWVATCHDMVDPSVENDEDITSYAIAVYDPGNLLDAKWASYENPDRDTRDSKGTATLPDGYTLTGGGCQTDVIGGSAGKMIIACYPSGARDWTARIHDWETAAHNVILTTYALGIRCNSLTIEPTMIRSTSTGTEQHGLHEAKLNDGIAIAGGGVLVNPSHAQLTRPDGYGNLVQQTYPSATGTWTEFNKDHAGSRDKVESFAYAIGLKAKINI